MASIKYNGISSKQLGLEITNEVTHELSSNDVEPVEIEGRDGVLLIDKKRLKPVERSYPMVLKNPVYDATTEISEWLGVKGWHDLELSWDEPFVYRATVINQISIEEVVRQFGKLRVAFLVHPIKYLKDSRNNRNIQKGATVQNRGNVEAKPIIELTGSGNTVLTINGRRTPLENVQGSIVLDMFNNMVYKDGLSEWDKLLYEAGAHKPFLDVGSNTINWTGDFTVKIKPMEGVRI